jgi:hypothetical protein
VPTELLNDLPVWLLLGIGLGLVVSVVVAAVFYFGDRLFPATDQSQYQHKRVDGTLRRHAEIRAYLNAIGEQFVEGRVLAGREVAFYLPTRDVAITFDPQVFFRLESADTYVVLCEHEMPVSQLGSRLPFEVPHPEREPATPTANGSVASAFDQLGLDQRASEDEVRSAYRSRVKKAHPDRGGTEAEFKELREAYTTAKDYTEQTT